MRILVARHITNTLQRELDGAGHREIGGVLVGEYLGAETFRIVDLSVQRTGGEANHFVRDPEQHRQFLSEFFERTGHDYARYNYFGEWHSHPTAPALPSNTDISTMDGIVGDPDVGAAFAVLLIARLHWCWGLQLSATAFRPGQKPDPVTLIADPNGSTQRFREVRQRMRPHFIRV
jgi:integrative and conjugative element protein (TIGR02256 family)